MKAWKGEDLLGRYSVSYKIDGVNISIQAAVPLSKAGKLFANVERFIEQGGRLDGGTYEFYKDSWAESVSLLKNAARADEITEDCFYSLEPEVDRRLRLGGLVDPTAVEIERKLQDAVAKGYEGLVLMCLDTGNLIKVKTKYSIDLRCTGFQLGKGKRNKQAVGVLNFQLGSTLVSVRAGISKEDSIRWFEDPNSLLGSIFEIEYTNLTPSGALRHARIVRQRFDKDNESLE